MGLEQSSPKTPLSSRTARRSHKGKKTSSKPFHEDRVAFYRISPTNPCRSVDKASNRHVSAGLQQDIPCEFSQGATPLLRHEEAPEIQRELGKRRQRDRPVQALAFGGQPPD